MRRKEGKKHLAFYVIPVVVEFFFSMCRYYFCHKKKWDINFCVCDFLCIFKNQVIL